MSRWDNRTHTIDAHADEEDNEVPFECGSQALALNHGHLCALT